MRDAAVKMDEIASKRYQGTTTPASGAREELFERVFSGAK